MALPPGREPLNGDWFDEKNIIKEGEEYVVVTTLQTFRHRYVVPMSKLQERNTDYIVDPRWALDCVTCEEVKEFSQLHLGEQILDMNVVNEKEVLTLFDMDNDYLKSWTKDKKLEYIHNCWDEHIINQSQERYHNFLTRKFEETREVIHD